MTTAYLGEFRANGRPMASAMLGLGSGLSVLSYFNSTMAPYVIAEFGWSKAEFALLSTFALTMILVIPIVGRLTDLFGVRAIASTGIVAFPLTLVALSLMTGDIRQYFGIYVVQLLLCASTSATVYSRIVAERFTVARGLALAVMASAPAVVGAIAGPLLTSYVDGHGWRAGFRAAATFCAVAGAVALLLMPRRAGEDAPAPLPRSTASRDYGAILRNPTFWIILLATVLCNLPQVIAGTQLKLVVLDQGINAATAGVMVTVFGVGVLIGRFICGLALDRFPTPIVAALGMGSPALGLFLLASGFDGAATVGLAIFVIGLSYGAEGDLLAYLVMRYFRVDIFSSVLGLVTAAIGLSTAAGAILLSLSLRDGGTFVPYLVGVGFAVLAGGGVFLMLARRDVPAIGR